MSCRLLALKTWTCRLMERVAVSTSFNLGSVFGLAGLTRTATRVRPGTNSRKNSSRFAANSVVKKLTCQVSAGPREAGDETDADRVLGNGKNDGNGRGGRLRCRRRCDSSA